MTATDFAIWLVIFCAALVVIIWAATAIYERKKYGPPPRNEDEGWVVVTYWNGNRAGRVTVSKPVNRPTAEGILDVRRGMYPNDHHQIEEL